MRALRRAAFALGLLITACGLTRKDGPASNHGGEPDGVGAAADSSQDAAGRAFTEGGGAGATRGAVGAGGAAGVSGPDQPAGAAAGSSGDPLSGDAAVCDGYVAAWLAREAEYVSGATACMECLGYNTDCQVARQAVTEGQDGCFRRHCLCDASDAGCEAALGSCACFGRCLPNFPDPVRQAWFDYMACDVEHCATACQ